MTKKIIYNGYSIIFYKTHIVHLYLYNVVRNNIQLNLYDIRLIIIISNIIL